MTTCLALSLGSLVLAPNLRKALVRAATMGLDGEQDLIRIQCNQFGQFPSQLGCLFSSFVVALEIAR